MFKKCLIFLFILTISYLCPICSSAQSDTKGGPAKDVCICFCAGNDLESTKIFSNATCTDAEFEFATISDKEECRKKDGGTCRGYIKKDSDVELFGKCEPSGDLPAHLYNCFIVSVPG